jgi:hypothetical protein
VGEEIEYVGGDDLGRLLAHDREERLQIERHRPQRVETGSTGHELQIAVNQWMAQREAPPTGRRRRPNETRNERHPRTIAATGGRHGDTRWITRVLGVGWQSSVPVSDMRRSRPVWTVQTRAMLYLPATAALALPLAVERRAIDPR